MKERVREALFNILADRPRESLAVDLFAGTGALGLEAVSRGAHSAVLIEQHRQHVAQLQENVARLKLGDRVQVIPGDAFRLQLVAELPSDRRWLVFCSPPYAHYHDRSQDLAALLREVVRRAPEGSTLVVEAERGFDASVLPDQLGWDLRTYPPAVLAFGQTPPA
jgi:16S rRNA (guanine966-N2)-methyltransferase